MTNAPGGAIRRSSRARPASSAERFLEIASISFLVVALLLGGAGSSYPVVGGLIEAFGLALIVPLSLMGGPSSAPRGTRFARWIGLLSLAVPVLQLIPLPPALWARLPGHDLPAHMLEAAGIEIGWRPLSLDPALTAMTALELLPGIALFWAALRLCEEGRLRLLSVAVGVAVLSALLGAMQKVAGNGSPLIFFATAHSDNAPGLFVNRNHEACFVLAAMPLLAAAMRAWPAARRLGAFERSAIFLTLLALLGAGAIATTSRMGLLLLLPATLAALAIGFGAQGRRASVIGVLSVAALGAALTSFSSAFGVAIARLGVEEDSRTLYWAATREAIVRFWPTGSGIGTFPRVYPIVEHLDTLDQSFPYNAHDDYLELLLEGGAPAFLLMIAAAAFLIVSLVRLLRRDRSAGTAMGLGAWCAMVLILLHSIVDYPLRMMSIMALFGLLAGIVARAAAPIAVSDVTRGTSGRATTARRGRTVFVSAIIVPGALFGFYRIVTLAGAQSAFFAGDFARGSTLAPRWSDASATLAQQDLRQGKLSAAHALALRAADGSPLDPQGPTALVLIDQARGERREADRILDALPALGWRHAPAQYLLAFRAADKGDLASAVPRADTLLRQGLYKAQFYPFLRAATAYPDGLSALAHQLSSNPKWRGDFMRNLADLRPADFPGHEALLTLMRRSSSRTQTEVNAYLLRVARNSDFRAAAAALDRLLGVAPGGNRIHDGSFRRLGDRSDIASPFDWLPVDNTGVTLDPSAEGLRITADSATTDIVLRQVLTAPPGRYRLTWQHAPRGAATGTELRWALRCLGGSYVPPDQRGLPTTAGRVDFVIPREKCETQQIELMLDHRSAEPLDITLSRVALAIE